MFTPVRPFKRRLDFSTPMSVKRVRPASTSVRAFRNNAKRYQRGVRRGGTLTSQVKSLQRFVSTLKPEIKYHDTSASAVNLTTTGAVDHITDIAQGDTDSTRTGNSINVVSVTFKGSLGNFNASVHFHYRVAIVQDKQQRSDTSPTAGDIFSDGISTSNPVTAVPTRANLERFKIIYMSPPYSSIGLQLGNVNNYYEFTKKMNLKVSYNGSASSDIEKNGLYCVFLTDDTSGAVDFNGLARIGFTDA